MATSPTWVWGGALTSTALSALNGKTYTVTVYSTWTDPPDPFAGVREPRRPLPTNGSDRALAEVDPG